jgi:hypothetical protein
MQTTRSNRRMARAGGPGRIEDDAPLAPAVAAAFRAVFEHARAFIGALRVDDIEAVRDAARAYAGAAEAAGVSHTRVADALEFLVREHGGGRWSLDQVCGTYGADGTGTVASREEVQDAA